MCLPLYPHIRPTVSAIAINFSPQSPLTSEYLVRHRNLRLTLVGVIFIHFEAHLRRILLVSIVTVLSCLVSGLAVHLDQFFFGGDGGGVVVGLAALSKLMLLPILDIVLL